VLRSTFPTTTWGWTKSRKREKKATGPFDLWRGLRGIWVGRDYLCSSVFTYQNIPILCVHDSFIVDYNFGSALKEVMKTAARTVVGSEIHLSNNYPGLDEAPDLSRGALGSH
jgi:hypothetical protein